MSSTHSPIDRTNLHNWVVPDEYANLTVEQVASTLDPILLESANNYIESGYNKTELSRKYRALRGMKEIGKDAMSSQGIKILAGDAGLCTYIYLQSRALAHSAATKQALTQDKWLEDMVSMRDESRVVGQYAPAIRAHETLGKIAGVITEDTGKEKGVSNLELIKMLMLANMQQAQSLAPSLGVKIVDGECVEV